MKPLLVLPGTWAFQIDLLFILRLKESCHNRIYMIFFLTKVWNAYYMTLPPCVWGCSVAFLVVLRTRVTKTQASGLSIMTQSVDIRFMYASQWSKWYLLQDHSPQTAARQWRQKDSTGFEQFGMPRQLAESWFPLNSSIGARPPLIAFFIKQSSWCRVLSAALQSSLQ